jgi:hypothetical protein
MSPINADSPLCVYYETVRAFRAAVLGTNDSDGWGEVCSNLLADLMALQPHVLNRAHETGLSFLELRPILAAVEERCWELRRAVEAEKDVTEASSRLDDALMPIYDLLRRPLLTAGTLETCIVNLVLFRANDGQTTPADWLARTLERSVGHIRNACSHLVRAGYIRSVRGAEGGYTSP